LALKLPLAVTAADAQAFIARWNRSMEYWDAGITSASQVPAGQSTEFIDLAIMRSLTAASRQALAESAAEGYERPEEGLRAAREDLIRFLSEGDGSGVCAHVRLRLEQEAIVTREAFKASLEIVNDSASPLSEVFVDVTVAAATGGCDRVLRHPTSRINRVTAVDGTGVIALGATGKASDVDPDHRRRPRQPEEFRRRPTALPAGRVELTVPPRPRASRCIRARASR
jgi:hypothetical protein